MKPSNPEWEKFWESPPQLLTLPPPLHGVEAIKGWWQQPDLPWWLKFRLAAQEISLIIQAKWARMRLTDLNSSLTAGKLLEYEELTAAVGSYDLWDLAEMRRSFAIPSLETQSREEEVRFQTAQRKILLEAAQQERQLALKLSQQERTAEANNHLHSAEWFYNRYDVLVQVGIDRSVEWGWEGVPLEDSTEVAANIDEATEQSEVVNLFFPPEVINAARERIEGGLEERVIKGEVKIPGVDPRWLQVWINHPPQAPCNRRYFQLAMQANDNLDAYLAHKYGVTVEQMRRYGSYQLQEMFPS